MAFASFPATQFVKVMETSEVVLVGGLTFPRDQELAHAYLNVYKAGTAGGSERLRLKVFHDADRTKLYATGEWATMRGAWGAAVRWIGRVRFDFDPAVNIEADATYYFAVESDGYTRNGQTFFISFPLDWPLSINTNVDSPSYGLAVAAYGRRGVTR